MRKVSWQRQLMFLGFWKCSNMRRLLNGNFDCWRSFPVVPYPLHFPLCCKDVKDFLEELKNALSFVSFAPAVTKIRKKHRKIGFPMSHGKIAQDWCSILCIGSIVSDSYISTGMAGYHGCCMISL
eukprot:Gb_27854 [translate_table: standard]